MTEKGAEKDLLKNFAALKSELVSKLKEVAESDGEKGTFMEIEGGADGVTLGLNSEGIWEGLAGPRQWVIGKNPSLVRLLSNYALASDDEDYVGILSLNIARNGKTDRINSYIERNKDRLITGLMGDMQSLLNELNDQPL